MSLTFSESSSILKNTASFWNVTSERIVNFLYPVHYTSIVPITGSITLTTTVRGREKKKTTHTYQIWSPQFWPKIEAEPASKTLFFINIYWAQYRTGFERGLYGQHFNLSKKKKIKNPSKRRTMRSIMRIFKTVPQGWDKSDKQSTGRHYNG